MEILKVKLLSKNATEPVRAHEHDAGIDIFAAETVTIGPQHRVKLATDIAVDIAPGYVGWLTGRSGIDFNTDLCVKEGKIDAGFHGHMTITIKNDHEYKSGNGIVYDVKGDFVRSYEQSNGTKEYQINKGDKIAQLLILPVALPKVEIVEDFGFTTERGEKGHGSTGV